MGVNCSLVQSAWCGRRVVMEVSLGWFLALRKLCKTPKEMRVMGVRVQLFYSRERPEADN